MYVIIFTSPNQTNNICFCKGKYLFFKLPQIFLREVPMYFYSLNPGAVLSFNLHIDLTFL